MSDCDIKPAKPPPLPGWTRSTRWRLLGVACSPLVLRPVSEWFSWSGMHLGFLGWLLQLAITFLMVGAVLGLPVCLVGCCILRWRRNAAWLLLCAVVAPAGLYLGERLSQPIRRQAIQGMAARAEPLIAAIRKFESTHGAPRVLTELVPQYLPAIPTPGLNSSPEFYYTREKRFYAHENAWIISVHAPHPPPFSGFHRPVIHDDGEVIYLPNQNYDERASRVVVERVGTWAYVHE